MNTLKLKNLSFTFGSTHNYLFNNFSFEVATGLNFIRGPNGTGKSTLLRIIAGTIHPTEIVSGTVVLHTTVYDLASPSDRLKLSSKIMLIPQDYTEMLADKFTGTENLTFAKFAKYPQLNFYSSKMNHVTHLKNFGIPLNTPTYLLSGGQKQMLSLGMALEKKPSVILLDEPTATLDNTNAHRVMTALKNLISENKVIVLCICHDHLIIEKYQDTCFELGKN